jgi:hypothetical protein
MANEKDTNLKTLGLKSPLEVIDILGALKIDGVPIINDEKVILNQQLKAEAIFKFFATKFGVKPNELPIIASLIKKKLKTGELRFGA